MKPGNIALTAVLIVAVGLLLFLYRTRPEVGPNELKYHGAQTLSFAGQTLELPEEWTRDSFSSSDTTLALKHGDARLTIIDQRAHPEIPGQFVSAWQRALENPAAGTQRPRSVDGYSDSDTNGARLTCLAERWDQVQQPLQLICLGSTGGWRLTLTGTDAEIPSLDMMARQMPNLERR